MGFSPSPSHLVQDREIPALIRTYSHKLTFLTRDITLCFWTRDHLQQLFPSYLQVVVKYFNFKPPFDRPGIQLPYLSI